MVPASLSKLAFWSRAHRWKKHEYDPAKAPHRPLVERLLCDHLQPLSVRLRKDHIDELITHILLIETTPEPLVSDPEPKQLLLLVARAQQAVERIEAEYSALQRKFNRFGETYSRVDDPAQQRYLIAQYLINTITDPKALKGDLKAIERYLGFDVLRERNATQLAHLSITIETGIEFIGLASSACLSHEDKEHRPRLSEFLNRTHTARFLSERLESGDRWQARLAAGEALLRMYQAGNKRPKNAWVDITQEVTTESPSPLASDDRTSTRERRQTVLEIIERCARNVEEQPWVQAKALELLLVLDPDLGRLIIYDRLFGERPEGVRTDFLFRRLALHLAGRYLRVLDATSLLNRMLERHDPSEHVRIGVCDTLTRLPPSAAISALTRIVGPSATVAEKSARVRGMAVIALSKVAVAGELDPDNRETVVEAIATVIEKDPDSLTLEIACAEVPAVAEAFGRVDPIALTERWGPRWKTALTNAICGKNPPPRVGDIAAATVEILERSRRPERHELTELLRPIIEDTRAGTRKDIPWSAFPASMAELAKDRIMLGRCLAELSRESWGLTARIGKRTLTIWRGDIFTFHWWRLFHEIRNPGPNKRQGYRHTWGRTPKSDLRAPPGRLEEVTPTTVPGERTHVDEAGGWGRYFPLVDDIIHLSILKPRPVQIFSSYGITTIKPAKRLWKRLKNWLWLTWRYGQAHAARQLALGATEPGERHRFVQLLAEKLDVEVSFTTYGKIDGITAEDETAMRILTLYHGKAAVAAREAAQTSAAAAFLFPLVDQARDWLATNGPYFLTLSHNSQTALALFLTVFLSWFFIHSHLRRRKIARARESIPLSIGGWGTRGKSGTERLKGGLFHGLGYHVLAKTTGCEAMFINAQPGQEATEIFLYRAYDKASIWEQADVVAMAEGVSADVFLWECMALNPRYVELLQHDWMQDDLVTLTNAYPDHEDIQGPAGYDVARVISTFVPKNSVVFTSEIQFLPLFVDRAKERHTEFHFVPLWEGDLIAGDFLDLFPYSEHPRNIALVASMAERLGLDRDLSMFLMAQNVVPDLGVLKSYGPACVRGRALTFVNGCSANERTGFLNNWRRTGMDKLDADADPVPMIITVVNNRADRISRSKVFADILVGDVYVDRHVLIGTNLKGLHSYLNTALDIYLGERRLVQPADFEESDPEALPMTRLAREMRRFRIPRPVRKAMIDRVILYATGAHLCIEESATTELGDRIEELLTTTDTSLGIVIDDVIRELESHKDVKAILARILEAAPRRPLDVPETLELPTHDDLMAHIFEILGKMVVRARLEARLRKVIATKDGIDKFHADFQTAYRALFARSIVTVHDPGTPGDRIVEMCADAVPPGTKVSLLGTQNIKGTGLDFVYRWIAIDKIITCLDQLKSNRSEQRMAALSTLEGLEDYGLFGAGLAKATLTDPSRYPTLTAQEDSLRERVVIKVDGIAKARRALIQSTGPQKGGSSKLVKVVGWMEAWFDYLDSIWRRRKSRELMRDLIHQRISLARAAIEMRAVVARQKGGWLLKILGLKK